MWDVFGRLGGLAVAQDYRGPAILRRTDCDSRRVRVLLLLCRYLLISGSRPGGRPLNLQGIWANSLKAKWEGDYHMNINLQVCPSFTFRTITLICFSFSRLELCEGICICHCAGCAVLLSQAGSWDVQLRFAGLHRDSIQILYCATILSFVKSRMADGILGCSYGGPSGVRGAVGAFRGSVKRWGKTDSLQVQNLMG